MNYIRSYIYIFNRYLENTDCLFPLGSFSGFWFKMQWHPCCGKHARNIDKAYIICLKNKSNSWRVLWDNNVWSITLTEMGMIKWREYWTTFGSLVILTYKTFICKKHSNSTDIKRSRVGDRSSTKLRTIKYTVISDSKLHKVCRIGFYHTHLGS